MTKNIRKIITNNNNLNPNAKMVDIVSIKMVREKSKIYENREIRSPLDIYELLKDTLEDADREMLIAVCLNNNYEPTNISTISIGSLAEATVHPREVFKVAILSNSQYLVLTHNHPSGSIAPSEHDRNITRRLAKAGEILGIELFDHIIISHKAYYSLRDLEPHLFEE